jgi:hypothetical protein
MAGEQHDSQLCHVDRPYPDPIEAICDVNLRQVYRAQIWVDPSNCIQDSPQRPAKLHGISWGQINGVLVY